MCLRGCFYFSVRLNGLSLTHHQVHYARYFLFSNGLVLFPAFLCPGLPKNTIPETILISYMPAYLANHFQPLFSNPQGKYPGLLLQIRTP